MKLFLSRRCYIFTVTSLLVVVLILTGCQDVVRRLDDKYRPVVPEPVRSVTVVADGIDSSGVPVRLVNLEVEDLELKVKKSDDGGEVPFTPELEADGTHAGLAYIRTPPNGQPISDFTVTVDVRSKSDGTVYASHTFTADRYPWRNFSVSSGESYQFELVKMFHFEQNRGSSLGASAGDGNVVLFTANDNEGQDVNESGSTITICDKNTAQQKGTGLTFYYNTSEAGSFKADQYDYVEIKFRSGESQAPEFAFLGESAGGRFGFWYDGGYVGAGEGIACSSNAFRVSDFSNLQSSHSVSSVDLDYDDSSTDWVTVGFHNGKDDKCLFTENLETATEKVLVSTKDFDYSNSYTVLYVGPGSTVEIDYVAFYRRVEE